MRVQRSTYPFYDLRSKMVYEMVYNINKLQKEYVKGFVTFINAFQGFSILCQFLQCGFVYGHA